MLLAYVTPPRPNLKVYLGFSACLWVCHFILFGTVSLSIYSQVSFVIFETLNDVKWRKRTGKIKPNPVSSCLKVGHSQEEKVPLLFLKSPKVTNRSKINICKKRLAI